MRLLWLGLATLALSTLPAVNYVVYAVGPNPTFRIGPTYIEVGYDKYYVFMLTEYVKYIILFTVIIILGYYELKKGVRPRDGSSFVGALAVVISAPLPLVFAEQGGLTLVVISNILSAASPILLLIASALELAEHYMLPTHITKIIATPESAVEKTEKA